MTVIDRVKSHFQAKEVKVIEVPEWGENDKPLMIYITPITLAQKGKLYKKAQDNDLSLMVDALIMKAKDAEGNNLFTLADKQDLLRSADPDIISRISIEIMGSADLDMENAEKNFLKPLK